MIEVFNNQIDISLPEIFTETFLSVSVFIWRSLASRIYYTLSNVIVENSINYTFVVMWYSAALEAKGYKVKLKMDASVTVRGYSYRSRIDTIKNPG